FQFDADFRQSVQSAQYFVADSAAVIKVARYEPIYVIGVASLERRAESGVPHLTGVDAPRVDNLRTARDRLFAKLTEAFVVRVGRMRFPIHHRDGPCIYVLVRPERFDERVELLQIVVVI